MQLELGGVRVRIGVPFAATVTLMLLLDESGVCALGLLCAALHEAGHLLCLLALGEKPRSLTFSYYGVRLERSPCAAWQGVRELAVYASGPAVNLLAALGFRLLSLRLPGARLAADVSVLLGLFNLLPCRPLDGGNLLHCLASQRLPPAACDRLSRCVSALTLLPMAACGVWLLAHDGSPTLALAAVYLAAGALPQKNGADERKL
ncbi:MAG: hypothetical protein IK080_00500 [Clostridia bacterium]|nr:hypothetical protein [Clostridia bacterium]